MKRCESLLPFTFAAMAMAFLILDAKTALYGAQEGIQLCLQTVIPSLFPFLVLSVLLTSAGMGIGIPGLNFLGKLCRIPAGAESLLLIGLLGGYPVGAQSIFHAYRTGSLKITDACRMLGFCNNAGPAFIFGMTVNLFHSPAACFALWGTHILSALLVGMLLPGENDGECTLSAGSRVTVPQALERAVRTMALICGWVVIFRVLTAILERWLLWLLPGEVSVLLTGLLELSNGCCALISIESQALRFILCAVMLSFGGLCVAMQTVSAVGELGTGLYFPGKLLQTVISFLLACLVQLALFDDGILNAAVIGAVSVCLVILGISVLYLRKMQNYSRNSAAAGV